jgi:hypothetical protein
MIVTLPPALVWLVYHGSMIVALLCIVLLGRWA